MTTQDAIREAVDKAGGSVTVAYLFGLKSQATVLKWIERGRVPPFKVLQLEKLSGVPRHRLAPDLYPEG